MPIDDSLGARHAPYRLHASRREQKQRAQEEIDAVFDDLCLILREAYPDAESWTPSLQINVAKVLADSGYGDHRIATEVIQSAIDTVQAEKRREQQAETPVEFSVSFVGDPADGSYEINAITQAAIERQVEAGATGISFYDDNGNFYLIQMQHITVMCFSPA